MVGNGNQGSALRSVNLGILGSQFVRSLFPIVPGLRSSSLATNYEYSKLLEFGHNLRDYWLEDFAILPGATNSFVEIAASREWMLVGSGRGKLNKTLQRLNNMHFVDAMGVEHRGYEECMKLRVKDWLTVGRTAVYSPNLTLGNRTERAYIEYLDPIYLYPMYNPETRRTHWEYRDPAPQLEGKPRLMDQDDVLFNDCIVKGKQGLFVGTAAYILPIARLDWLIREHLSGKLDGRIIRDIIFVQSDDMVDAMTEAVAAAVSLAVGEGADEDGNVHLPIVAINELMQGTGPVKDSFATLGLSQLPEVFKPEEFLIRYINEIGNAYGLNPSYFWRDTRMGGTRGNEQMAAERQSVQGPSMFVRSDARAWNNSGMLPDGVRFHYQEEVDSISGMRRAETLKLTVESLTGLKTLVSPTMDEVVDAEGKITYLVKPRENPDLLDATSILAHLQREKLISTDLHVDNLLTLEQDSLTRSMVELDYGDMVIDSQGRILEKRNKQVRVAKNVS